jgi:hypothetical protein
MTVLTKGKEVGIDTNYPSPAVRKGARDPNMLHIFLSSLVVSNVVTYRFVAQKSHAASGHVAHYVL